MGHSGRCPHEAGTPHGGRLGESPHGTECSLLCRNPLSSFPSCVCFVLFCFCHELLCVIPTEDEDEDEDGPGDGLLHFLL